MSNPEPEPAQKRRKRKTRKEREAERQAEFEAQMAKPIDPVVWMLLGGVLLFFAVFTYVDPVTLSEGGQPADQSIFQIVPLLLVTWFGRLPAALCIGVPGLFFVMLGLIGWIRSRLAQ